jgi:AraC family transcriptional regulator
VSRLDVVNPWLVATFATAPTLAHADWHTYEPHRVVVCPDPGNLQPTRRPLTGRLRVPDADIWVIPAQRRGAASDHGAMTEYCELELPRHPFHPGASGSLIQRRHPLTVHLLDHIHHLSGRRGAEARLLGDSLKEALRLSLIDLFTPCAQTVPGTRRTLREEDQIALLDHIDEHRVGRDLSIAALAARVDMTPSTFTRAFSAAFHTTPHQFVLDRRIAQAKYLLCSTDQPVTEISAALGFSTHNHFTTVFRERIGMTPAQYRSDGPDR